VRCRKCGDRFEVRNPKMPSPTEPLESPRMEPEKEAGPPEPPQAPGVALKVPEAVDPISSLRYQYREKESFRSGRGRRAHPAGGRAAYYLAGSIIIVLGVAVALLVPSELRQDQPTVPDKTSEDVHISYSYITRSPMGVQMFVLQGSVRDTREEAAPAPIRLRVKLFNAKKDVLAEKTVLAGSDIPGIGFPEGMPLDNSALKEGWVPFTVVFFDPGVIADFSVTFEPS